MDLVSVPVYGKNPSTILKTNATPNNGTGLCNQIFHFINTLHFVRRYNEKVDIYFDHFSRDIISGDHINIREIIDISRMNSQYGFDLRSIEEYKGGVLTHFPIGYVFMAHDQDPEFFEKTAKKIIFNKKYEDLVQELIDSKGLKSSLVNLVHLRIDRDCREHILKSKGKEQLVKYLDCFRTTVFNNCHADKPLVLLLEDVDDDMVLEFRQRYEVVLLTKDEVKIASRKLLGSEIEGREIFALIDLLFGKNLNVDKFIYAGGDIFSSSFGVLLSRLANYKNAFIV